MEKFKFVIFFLLSALLAESCADSTILIMDGPETVTSDEQTVYYKPLFFPDAKVTLISVAYSLYDMSWNYIDGAGYVEAQYYKKGDCYAEDWFRVKASGSTVEVSFAENDTGYMRKLRIRLGGDIKNSGPSSINVIQLPAGVEELPER